MNGIILYDEHLKLKRQILIELGDADLSIAANISRFGELTSTFKYGCSLCRSFFDEEKKLFVDYEFLEVNKVFEKVLEIDREQLLGKKVSELKNSFSAARFDFINVLGHVARYKSNTLFYFGTEDNKHWYSASAFSPEKSFFIFIIEEITEAKLEDIEKRKAASKNQQMEKAAE